MPTEKNEAIKEFFQAILSLKNNQELSRFCHDLLSAHEIKEIAYRYQVAKMLKAKVPYCKIEAETGLSSATIAKISHDFKKGAGGYKLALKRMEDKIINPKSK